MSVNKRYLFTSVLIVMVSMLVLSCGRSTADLDDRMPAPDFTLENIDGERYNFYAETEGKVVMLNFWAERCPSCRVKIPGLVGLASKYGDSGLEIIGIDVDSVPSQRTRVFAERNNINYTLLTGDRSSISEVANAYGPIRFIPATFVIDREKRIVENISGPRDAEYFESMLEELL